MMSKIGKSRKDTKGSGNGKRYFITFREMDIADRKVYYLTQI